MIISSSRELNALREGGRMLAAIMKRLQIACEPGKSTVELDELAKRLAFEWGVKPAFEGYQGFPNALCVSLNDEVAHGVCREDKILKGGDMVSLDFGIIYKELYTDHAITFGLGELSVEKGALIEVTQKALEAGINTARAGVRTGDIGFVIEQFVKQKGNFGIVRRLVGHGIGYKIHEEPKIPNFGMSGTGYQLHEGEVIAIEPMLTLGSDEVLLANDNFTYKTSDGSPAAHFEKTLVVDKDGVEVIT